MHVLLSTKVSLEGMRAKGRLKAGGPLAQLIRGKSCDSNLREMWDLQVRETEMFIEMEINSNTTTG